MSSIIETAGPTCSLDGADFQRRIALIGELNDRHLLRSGRSERMLTLEYAAEALPAVVELQRLEQKCCPFLTFTLRRQDSTVVFDIEVADHLVSRADALLAPFEGDAASALGGCCGSCPPQADATPAVSSNKAAGTALGSAATAIVACGACCVLPIAFPALAIGASGSVLAWLGAAHAWLTGLAVLAVVGAWAWIWRQSRVRRAKAASATVGMMAVATAATALAVVWPTIEEPLMSAVTASEPDSSETDG